MLMFLCVKSVLAAGFGIIILPASIDTMIKTSNNKKYRDFWFCSEIYNSIYLYVTQREEGRLQYCSTTE